MKISLNDARRVALHAQQLDENHAPESGRAGPGKAGTLKTIEHLGYVQIDTIHIIQRAHHHTLWARLPDYTPGILDELLEERHVFEWWTHAMSYIPMRDYRYYAPRMGPHALWGQQREWLKANPDVVAHVKDRIRVEGPLGAADFKKPKDFNGGWWDWKPAKKALEILASMGEVMVAKRRNFHRIFDLTERVLPADVDITPPGDDELQRFIIRFALNGRGVLRESEIKWGYRQAEVSALQATVDAGEVSIIEVEGIDGEPCYALSEVLHTALNNTNNASRVHILSPFDNLTIDRKWLKAFFDNFHYTLECYLPATKRKYGYFVLPILWQDKAGNSRFIARMDTKADRKPRNFIVRRLLFEADFDEYSTVLPALADALRNFAAFNDCDTVSIEEIQPGSIKQALEQALA